jgi:hypothetical protein
MRNSRLRLAPLLPLSRVIAAGLILGIALGGCWLKHGLEDKGPDDPSGWAITKSWTGGVTERKEPDAFTVTGPWALEWEMHLRTDSSGFTRLKIELLGARGDGKPVDTLVATTKASSGLKRYAPGTYRLRIKSEGSSRHSWLTAWRVAVREKGATR